MYGMTTLTHIQNTDTKAISTTKEFQTTYNTYPKLSKKPSNRPQHYFLPHHHHVCTLNKHPYKTTTHQTSTPHNGHQDKPSKLYSMTRPTPRPTNGEHMPPKRGTYANSNYHKEPPKNGAKKNNYYTRITCY